MRIENESCSKVKRLSSSKNFVAANNSNRDKILPPP